jgi:hypothetical protein
MTTRSVRDRTLEDFIANPNDDTRFAYAWSLIHSDDEEDWPRGHTLILQSLPSLPAGPHQRDMLYLNGVVLFKLGRLVEARAALLQCCSSYPEAKQAKDLVAVVEDQITRDAAIGMGIVSIGLVAATAIGVAVFKALTKKH